MPLNTLLSHARSLRIRLMLWNAGAVAATGLLVLLAVRTGVQSRLISEMDEVLREDLKEITLHFEDTQAYNWSTLTEDLDRKAEGHDFHRWFVRFYDSNDQPTWSSRSAPKLPPPTTEQKRPESFTINDYRLSYGRLNPPPKEAAYVCVGCQDYVARDMETIDRLVMVAGFA